MTKEQQLDTLFTELGAAIQDAETGKKLVALFSHAGSLGKFFAPGADNERLMALWGLDQESLKAKGLAFWKMVSPILHTLLCDKNSIYHQEFFGLLQDKMPGLDAALAGLLMGALSPSFPVVGASAVAFFLAKLIIKLFFSKTLELTCKKWQKSL